MHSRFRIAESRLEGVSFHVPIVRDGFRLRLLPAGHIAGSAMLHVTRIADNASLLYTGDFKTRRSRTAEAVNFLTADTLILETTFGLPGYEFPNPMEIDAEVLRFIDDCFTDGETPVLLAYSLGKAQEALALLEEHSIPALLHPAAAAMTRACRDAGVRGLPEPLEFEGFAAPGHVIIAPPNSLRTKLFKGIKAKRTAMLSGWALQPGAKYRYRVDAMIPFSDHADHPGLMECIQRVRPRRVLTVHGYAHEFAAELRARNLDAWSAAGGDQMELPIQRPAPNRPQAIRGPWHKRVVCQLADFSDLCRLVSETGSRIAKIRFIAAYLATLESDDDLRTAVNWLGLTPSRQRGKSPAKLDTATLRHALTAIPGARSERLREIHLAQKDSTRSARIFLQELQLQPDMLDLPGTVRFIHEYRSAPASMDCIQRLATRLATLNPAEGETLIKLLTNDLRLGIDAAIVEESIAAAFKAATEAVAEAIKLTGDAATTAVLARQRRLNEAGETAGSKTKEFEPSDVHVTGELPFPPG